MATTHATCNLETAEDLAPKFGMADMGQAHFVRGALGAERIGLSHYRMNPGRRVGFGHRHGESEEVYVVVSGSGRFKVDDDVFPVAEKDVIYARRRRCASGRRGPTASSCSPSAVTRRATWRCSRGGGRTSGHGRISSRGIHAVGPATGIGRRARGAIGQPLGIGGAGAGAGAGAGPASDRGGEHEPHAQEALALDVAAAMVARERVERLPAEATWNVPSGRRTIDSLPCTPLPATRWACRDGTSSGGQSFAHAPVHMMWRAVSGTRW